MSPPPKLTDRAALARNRTRAADAPEDFLHALAADEVKDRLAMVNKSFNAPAIVTGHPGFWADVVPGARIVADDEVLDLKPVAHDLLIHAMALHWAGDPVGQMIQCLRALKPDGVFLAILFGGQTLHELRAALGQAEVEITGGLSPRVVPMGEIRDLGGLLQRAGFALPVADSLPLTASYETPLHLMRELRAMGEQNALVNRLKHFTRLSVIRRASELYASAYAEPDGRVRATFELIFLMGWAPDPNQPQPLRPGSAQSRLAEALGTVELPLKD
ncbi:SAM-dependent methyltransferase [Marimonas arenosa]|uniref:SAM-dependent methyltransferase n=1 Tax=Marimonas arenosa TaxID=1795305 RepID=A0AAE4B5J4_9RHOB|nr:SAM-dependent methyltransferase [Marimonas arenosa]MDQ2090394.1 SAM-dependent methyltransferase [Marimonas arenosa]